MVFPDSENIRASDFIEYAFNSHYLTPCDGWSFTLDTKARVTNPGDTRTVGPSVEGAKDGPEGKSAEGSRTVTGGFDAFTVMKPGTRIELHLNGSLQSTGYIDAVEISASRGSGTVYRVEGRDALAQAVDSCADPVVSFKEGQTLDDVLETLFKPFGFEGIDISNEADRELRTTAFRAKTKQSEGKGFGKRALKEFKAHQTRPYPREGVFEFASRLSQRFGLWISPSADGRRIIVATPNFEQAPETALFRFFEGQGSSFAEGGGPESGGNNVLEGSVRRDISEQPTMIICDSYSKGGEFGPGRAKCIVLNKALRILDSSEDEIFKKYVKAGAKILGLKEDGVYKNEGSFIKPFPVESLMEAPRHRPVFLHDDESATQEHLEAYALREMALFQRKSITAKYVVEGHGQMTANGYRAWTVDTTVHVFDELAGLDEIMYVLSRTFHKSRDGGTTTELELIRLDTLTFSDTGK